MFFINFKFSINSNRVFGDTIVRRIHGGAVISSDAHANLLNSNETVSLITHARSSPITLFRILLFILLLAFIALYRQIKKNDNYWKHRQIPYKKPFFLLGSLYDILRGPRPIGKYLGYLYKQFTTPYFGIVLCGKPYLVIKSPSIIKNILIRDFQNFSDRTFACDPKSDVMAAKSLFLARNPEWKILRNRLSGIFSSLKLKNMYPLMVTKGKEMQMYLQQFNGQIIEIKEVNGKFMTDVMASCFFGFESKSFDRHCKSKFREICRRLVTFTNLDYFRLYSYFLLPEFVSIFKMKFLDSRFLCDVFLQALHEREQSGLDRNDFIDLLINIRNTVEKNGDVKHKFDATSMVAQGFIFFLAGFETTSNLLSFALYELSLREECQDKLRQEIIKYFPDNIINYDKIQELKYLDMVIFEVLRRYPFASFINRKCKENYIIEETGYQIDKGTPILIPIDGIHMDNNFYVEPEKFEPERFKDGVKHLVNQCILIPFGVGPRNCIGERFGLLSAKIGLIHFLQKFRVERCQATQIPIKLDSRSPFVTPTDGIYLKLIKL